MGKSSLNRNFYQKLKYSSHLLKKYGSEKKKSYKEKSNCLKILQDYKEIIKKELKITDNVK